VRELVGRHKMQDAKIEKEDRSERRDGGIFEVFLTSKICFKLEDRTKNREPKSS